MHFRGINNISVDAKGRMAMPARYRERLLESCGGRLVVTVDRDHCLLVYPLPEWEIIEEKLIALPSLNKQARLLQRLIIGYATELEMDGQGRILLPAMLREYAGLNKKAVLIGQGKKLKYGMKIPGTKVRKNGWLRSSQMMEIFQQRWKICRSSTAVSERLQSSAGAFE